MKKRTSKVEKYQSRHIVFQRTTVTNVRDTCTIQQRCAAVPHQKPRKHY